MVNIWGLSTHEREYRNENRVGKTNQFIIPRLLAVIHLLLYSRCWMAPFSPTPSFPHAAVCFDRKMVFVFSQRTQCLGKYRSYDD